MSSSENSWVSSGQFNLDPQQNWQQIFASKKDIFNPSNLIVYLSGNFSSYFEGKSIPPKNAAEVDTGTGKIKIDTEDQAREIVPSNSKGHLIVAGDSDFMSSQGAAPGNIMWLLNVVDWISLDENLISIRSRTLVDRTIKDDKLEAGNSYSAMIRYTNVMLMPIIVIIFGIIIFFRRREVEVSSSSSTEKKEMENK